MIQHIRTGERTYYHNYIKEIITHEIPNLHYLKLKDDWVGFALHIMDNLATDFNLYMFFEQTMPNLPSKFLFNQFGEAILDLCKMLDNRKQNKVAINKILNYIEQNIKSDSQRRRFLFFKGDVLKWLQSKDKFIKNILTVRDKFIAHIDIDPNDRNEYKKAFSEIQVSEFIDVSNTIIQIYCEIIKAIKPVRIPYSYYNIDEFNFIYECLRSLDKIEKNVTRKNILIHEVDLLLQEVKKLIK